MDWLAQASETNTRYAVPNIGPDPVTYINIYNYQAVSRHCDSRSALANTYLNLNLSKINGLQNDRKNTSV